MAVSPGNEDLGIIAPWPPPYGGISVGVQRVAALLDRAGANYLVYNETGTGDRGRPVVAAPGYRRLFLQLLRRGPRRVLHYHSPDWRMRCLVALWGMLLRRRTAITVHGQSLEFSLRGGGLRAAAVRFFLRRTSVVIACNPRIYEIALGIVGDSGRVRMIPAFVRPAGESAPPLPERVERFLASHTPRLLWIGWPEKIEGRDLYGLDLVVDLVDRLRGAHPGLGCVLVFSRVTDRRLWEAREREIRARGLERHFHFEENGIPEVHPAFERVDVYVRPNLSDGDSVAVREALAAGTPVVTSDAAPRPEGCVLFPSGDAAAFAAAVASVLADAGAARARVAAHPVRDFGPDVVRVYHELGVPMSQPPA